MERYIAMRNRGSLCIYNPELSKMAEVFGGVDELKNARLIVNGLNMRHRWLEKNEREAKPDKIDQD